LSYLKKCLGDVTLVVAEFLEGEETLDRFWTEIPETGGMIAETLIHPFTMVKNIVGVGKKIEFSKISWVRTKERQKTIHENYNRNIGPTYADLIGHVDECQIRIRVGKYTNEKKRIMSAIYQNGKIIADFDRQECSVYLHKKIRVCIGLKHTGKYETQQLLFHEFMQKGWKGLRFDGFPNQVDVLLSCLEISPGDSEILTMERDKFNSWLNENLLFDSGELKITMSKIDDRFGPLSA
jgi:hypothetical protein